MYLNFKKLLCEKNNNSDFMTGKNLKLRAPEPEDIDLLYNWENDQRLWYLSHTQTPFSRFVLEQYILNSHQDIYTAKQLRMMIVLKNSGETVGMVDLFDFEPAHRRAGIGILISETQQKHGFASETLDLIIDYAFNTLMLKQLYCNILPENTASIHLFTKKGFHLIGNKKEWLLIENQWKDEQMYQLINPKSR